MSADAEKILFVTELSSNGDEGMRNWIKMADRALANQGRDTEVLRLEGDPRWATFLPDSRRRLRRVAPTILVYVPYSGLTSKALVRHAALQRAARPRVDVLVTLQADSVVRGIPRILGPAVVAYASERLHEAHCPLGRHSCVLPPIVDTARFRQPTGSRQEAREYLDLPNDKPMALHVGHLRRSRGLEPLAELAATETANVVVVASTSTEPDPGVEDLLRKAGVLVKREFLPEIERWYQAADVYVFPVVDLQGSIEIPLTVLEAMACGTPVATTPFGGLTSLFAGTECLRFVPADRLADTASQMVGLEGLSNRSLVNQMDDAAFAKAFEHATSGAIVGG